MSSIDDTWVRSAAFGDQCVGDARTCLRARARVELTDRAFSLDVLNSILTDSVAAGSGMSANRARCFSLR